MPWDLSDVSRHTKKATTDAEKRKWVAIANDVLKADGDEGKAIRIANAKCCESEETMNDIILNMLKTSVEAPKSLTEAVPSDVKPTDTPVCAGTTKAVYEFMVKAWERIQKAGEKAMIKPEAYWAYMTKGLRAVTDVNEVALLDFGMPASVVVETLNEAMFHVGEKVVANVDAQGMKKGQEYEITNTSEMPTPFGTFVDYELDGKLWIGNGHFVLSPVKVKEAAEAPAVKPEAKPAAPAGAKAFEYKTLHLHRKGGKIEKIPLEQIYPKLEPYTKKHFKHPREALVKSHPDQVLKVFQKTHGADVEAWSIPAEKKECCNAPVFAALFLVEMLKPEKGAFGKDLSKTLEAFEKSDWDYLEKLFPNSDISYLQAIVNESKTALDEIGAEQVDKLFPNISSEYLVNLRESELKALAARL